jgi:hypothetical protein
VFAPWPRTCLTSPSSPGESPASGGTAKLEVGFRPYQSISPPQLNQAQQVGHACGLWLRRWVMLVGYGSTGGS